MTPPDEVPGGAFLIGRKRGMRNLRLCLDVFEGIPEETLYPAMRAAGFDGFFTPPDVAHDLHALRRVKRFAEGLGLFQETVHSSIGNCWSIWHEGPEGDAYTELLLRNVDHCAAIGVPVLVVHPQTNLLPGAEVRLGLPRLQRVVAYAAERGVRIAIENVDSDELLTACMETFREPHVGFCYDSGHECWLTPDAHYLRRYGDRLLCLHLNDNDKTWDKHFLPGDGKADWEGIIAELRAAEFRGPVTLEVAYKGDYPVRYTPEAYVQRCYEIASEIAEKLA